MEGWIMMFMMFMMYAFWALVIIGSVALVRSLGERGGEIRAFNGDRGDARVFLGSGV